MPTPRKRRPYPHEFEAAFALALRTGSFAIPVATPSAASRLRRYLYAFRIAAARTNPALYTIRIRISGNNVILEAVS